MIGSEIQITVSNLPRFESWYDLTFLFFFWQFRAYLRMYGID